MFIMFILFWQVVIEKYWILKSVCLETWVPARARGRSMLKFCYRFSSSTVCEKEKDNQTTHGCILAVSCEFHPRGLKHIFSQPSFGNCNLFVLTLFPLGPVFIGSYMCFSFFVIFHAIYYHQSSFSPVGRFLSLGWDFGTLLVFDCRCLQRVRGMKNPVKFLRRLSQLSKHENLLSTSQIVFGLDS